MNNNNSNSNNSNNPCHGGSTKYKSTVKLTSPPIFCAAEMADKVPDVNLPSSCSATTKLDAKRDDELDK